MVCIGEANFAYNVAVSWWDRVQFIVAQWRHMEPKILVNIDSGNDFVTDGTKPLSEPMLAYHQYGLVPFRYSQYHHECK